MMEKLIMVVAALGASIGHAQAQSMSYSFSYSYSYTFDYKAMDQETLDTLMNLFSE